MSSGYLYCITNPSMPDLVKIGMTTRTMEERLDEANSNSTWTPFPYRIEFAKTVLNVEHRERTLHHIFHSQRVSARREWFRLPVETVRLHFDLMDGPWWSETESPIAKSMGQEIVTQFLNENVYPNEEVGKVLQWDITKAAFSEWKKLKNYHYGNANDLRTALVGDYGRPPWSDIRLKMESLP